MYKAKVSILSVPNTFLQGLQELSYILQKDDICVSLIGHSGLLLHRTNRGVIRRRKSRAGTYGRQVPLCRFVGTGWQGYLFNVGLLFRFRLLFHLFGTVFIFYRLQALVTSVTLKRASSLGIAEAGACFSIPILPIIRTHDSRPLCK